MINKLISLLSPPSQRIFDNAAWAIFESKLSLRLPNDFKKFISIYGCGAIDDFVWVLNPFSKNPNLNFEKSKYFINAYAVMRQDFLSDYPRPDYPAEGSFLPWAVTDNGETFVWVVDGEPDSWKVAIHSSDQGEEEVYNFGCVEFILKLVNREISSKILPSQFPPVDTDKHFFTAVD
ncbi:SMI1/KNR4 family protein [Duffyella gerundensis]|uniref:SMI1/KNR4 family protein n=1 Tax=Duffyella TaxID=3026546 RepID=UPI003F6DF49C